MEERKILHEGEIVLGNNVIPCYVLEDGTRVLSELGMQNALKIVEDNFSSSGGMLPRFLNTKSLKPFIFSEECLKNDACTENDQKQSEKQSNSLIHNDKNLAHKRCNEHDFKPLVCYKGSQKINGYEATVLADVCDAMLEARNSIKLTPRQKIVADQCEILIRGFARVGIIALIDEATGYQYYRERYELERILNAYVSEEILRWQLTFTDEFYKEVFRLWKLPFIPKYIRNKPSFIGKLTSKYIYDMLPKGVVDKIKEKAEKTEGGNYRYRWHQSLTPEVGKEHLKKQIHEVTTLMSISQSKEHFNSLFKQKYNLEPAQLTLEFEENVK